MRKTNMSYRMNFNSGHYKKKCSPTYSLTFIIRVSLRCRAKNYKIKGYINLINEVFIFNFFRKIFFRNKSYSSCT